MEASKSDNYASVSVPHMFIQLENCLKNGVPSKSIEHNSLLVSYQNDISEKTPNVNLMSSNVCNLNELMI